MTRIGAVILKPGFIGAYHTHLVIRENGAFRHAIFMHVSGNRYERQA